MTKAKNKDGHCNIELLTEDSVLKTSWKFDDEIRDRMLAIAGYVFCPKKSEFCSGVPVSKQSIWSEGKKGGGKPVDHETTAQEQSAYSAQASSINDIELRKIIQL